MSIDWEKVVRTIGAKVIEKEREEGMQQGMQQGEVKKAQEAVLRFLEARFGKVAEEMSKKLRSIQEMEKLDSLISLAATCGSLSEFEAGM